MRLVVDKSRKKHIPSSRNCERIDFNNYIQGGYYLAENTTAYWLFVWCLLIGVAKLKVGG